MKWAGLEDLSRNENIKIVSTNKFFNRAHVQWKFVFAIFCSKLIKVFWPFVTVVLVRVVSRSTTRTNRGLTAIATYSVSVSS